MAAKWRRCQKCRKVLPVDDFDGDETTCRDDAARSSGASATVTRVTTSTQVRIVPQLERTAPRDIRGRGDAEVRARRARGRALERLAERHPEDYEFLLREERTAEGL